MTNAAPSFDVFRCPACNKPTTASLASCRHCSTVLCHDMPSGNGGFLDRVFGIKTGAGQFGCLAVALSPLIAGIVVLALPDRQESGSSSSLEMPPVSIAEMPVQPVPVSYKTYSKEGRALICRAAIAALFGRDVKTIRATERTGGLMRVSYRRPDDGTTWKSDCQVDEDRVIWRSVDAFGSDRPGRWRDDPADDKVSFTMKKKTVTTTLHYADGSIATDTFRF